MNFVNLQHPIRWIFIFHVIGGSVALGAFLIPLISKKGGKLHIKAGWTYSYAMILVGLSAFVITPWRVFFDSARTPSSQGFALFLFFIAFFTLSALWDGLSVLKLKNRKAPSKDFRHLAPPAATVLLAFVTQLMGLHLHDNLLIGFPFIGYFLAAGQFHYWLTAPKEKMHWWYAHMNGMITACIATVTAFAVIAVPRIWPSPIAHSLVLWIAPGLVLGTILGRWTVFYKNQFGDA